MSKPRELKVTCHNCEEKVGTGIWMNESTFKSSTFINNICNCRMCDAEIVWNKEDVLEVNGDWI